MDKETFLKAFFQALSSVGIDYFVFGEYSHLPQDTGESDVDIYVDHSGLEAVDRIICNLSSIHSICIASFYKNYHAHHFRLQTMTWGVQIDLEDFKYKGIDYYPLPLLREWVIDYHGIKVLEHQKGYCLDFFKEILHNGKAKDKYIKGFVDEVKTNRDYYQQEIFSFYGEKATQFLFSNLNIDDIKSKSKELQNILQKNLYKGKLISVMIALIKKMGRICQKRPGYVIVIEGTDGSGKSTIINAITPILNEGFHNSVIYKHLRPHAIPDMGILLRKRNAADYADVCTNPHNNKVSGFYGSLVRWLYYLVDYSLGYVRVVWPKIHTRSYVFIFDRYYYDYYIDPKRLRVNLPKWILRLGEWIIPNPDLILSLGGNPEKIYSRKPETSFEEVCRQVTGLKQFCSKRSNAVWIDTTTTLDESVNKTMSAILSVMKKRFNNVVAK